MRISDRHQLQVKKVEEKAASEVKRFAVIAFYFWVLLSLFEITSLRCFEGGLSSLDIRLQSRVGSDQCAGLRKDHSTRPKPSFRRAIH